MKTQLAAWFFSRLSLSLYLTQGQNEKFLAEFSILLISFHFCHDYD